MQHPRLQLLAGGCCWQGAGHHSPRRHIWSRSPDWPVPWMMLPVGPRLPIARWGSKNSAAVPSAHHSVTRGRSWTLLEVGSTAAAGAVPQRRAVLQKQLLRARHRPAWAGSPPTLLLLPLPLPLFFRGRGRGHLGRVGHRDELLLLQPRPQLPRKLELQLQRGLRGGRSTRAWRLGGCWEGGVRLWGGGWG